MSKHGPNTQGDDRGKERQDNEGHQGGQYGGSQGKDRGKPDEKSNPAPSRTNFSVARFERVGESMFLRTDGETYRVSSSLRGEAERNGKS